MGNRFNLPPEKFRKIREMRQSDKNKGNRNKKRERIKELKSGTITRKRLILDNYNFQRA